MILMIDSRTDIVQYYSRWLENRFNEGFLYVRNPAYPTKVQKIIFLKPYKTRKIPHNINVLKKTKLILRKMNDEKSGKQQPQQASGKN